MGGAIFGQGSGTGAVGPQLGDVGANLYTPLGTWAGTDRQLYTHAGGVASDV